MLQSNISIYEYTLSSGPVASIILIRRRGCWLSVAIERWLSTRLSRMPGCYDLGVRSSWYIRDKISHLERAEMIGSIQMVLCCIMKSDMINIPARGCQTFGQSRLRIPRRRKERCIRNPVNLYPARCQMTSQAAFLLQSLTFLVATQQTSIPSTDFDPISAWSAGKGGDTSIRIDNRVLVAAGIFTPEL